MIVTAELPDCSSNHDAEVIAIQKAIEHSVQDKEPNKVHLYTDSLSALNALKNPLNRNPMIYAKKKKTNAGK